ncbi:MAG TPA: SurA N-terminal domain-containing protein [Chitinophagaceae bacterium]|nr:SurA N-terminal domain-containing protein [Chitinophagaceae bacterium]MCC6636084.1 SurA N-terminal domain-containing protein [Chitinophagaceae bacterium]HMZ45229.1 SurA N-terminal domain-containing protein [Chitinophagaceae bacterium]HNE92700.1 SurA N-terminal domain-containing protein [Chitinophagaceae bacterium]HNF28789.1 SurA N-terminal domain-containing protein [Chitinophagaceae bacterium]
MSIIQNIREKGAWLTFGFIAVALIAFILMDGVGRGGAGMTATSTIGKVNGTAIELGDFDQKLNMYSQGGQDRNSILPQLWNMEVERILLEQECEKLGITVTGKEVGEILFGENSPLKREKQFVDDNGNFKAEEARQAFAQLKNSKNNDNLQGVIQTYVEPIKQQALKAKYDAILQQSVYVPTWLVEKTKADNSGLAKINYVFVPYTSISDSTVKDISDNEIAAYIKKHPAGFEQKEEGRSFSYVVFSTAPSAIDSLNTLNNILSLKPEFAKEENAEAYLGRIGTEIPYLNAFLPKKDMKMPNADSIKALADGSTFGPYLDGGNLVIAKMIGKRNLPDSVKVRHILVKTEDRRNPVLEDSIAKKRIDSVEALVKSGADFNQLVQKYSDDGGSKATKGEYDFALQQFSGISKEFAETIFYGKAGDKKIVKVENDAYSGYHYIEVISQKNFSDAVKVAYLAKPILASNETMNAANSAALQFAAKIKNKKQFEEEALKLNKSVMIAQDVKENDFTIPNFQQASVRNLVRWLYEKKVDAVSEPMEIGENFVVSILTGVNKVGLKSVASARPMVEPFVRNEKKAKLIIESKFKGSTLEEYASSSGTSIQSSDSVYFSNPVIANMGYDLKVTGSSFNKDMVGKVTPPMASNAGVVAVKVITIGTIPPVQDDAAIKQNILGQMRNAAFRSAQALRNAATIKDYRFKVY